MAESRASPRAGQRRCWIPRLLVLPLLALPAAALAEPVDLELVLAVDVSSSVSRHEYELQMRGLADAFRSAEVIAAIRAYAPHGVAVALFQWGGTGEQAVMMPWSAVRGGADAEAVAGAIDLSLRLSEYGGTALGEAILVAAGMFEGNGFEGARRVIDVSGDGHANLGIQPAQARDAALAVGITVNGLVIVNEEPDLADYYHANVIGGAGAFLIGAVDFEDFSRAIRAKLVREIGGAQLVERGPENRAEGPRIAARPAARADN